MFSAALRSISFLLSLLVLILTACTPAAAVQPGLAVQVKATPTAAPVKITPTTAPAPQEVATKQPIPTQALKVDPAGPGYVLFDREKQEFQTYSQDGRLAFNSLAPGINDLSRPGVQPVGTGVYFYDQQAKALFRTSPAGISKINIPGWAIFGYAVSPDEKQIAWSTIDPTNSISALWIANMDGSDARQAAKSDAADSGGIIPFVYNPLEWTADGKLVFDRAMVGFGGYILFFAHNSLYTLDPGTGEVVPFVQAEERHGYCLDSYRLDLKKVVFNCSRQGMGQMDPDIIIRDLSDQSEKTLPRFASQRAAGSARFSPSGKWLAYAIAASNPDNESGQVVVVPRDGSALPAVIAEVKDNSYAYIQGWLDEDTILFSKTQNTDGSSTVWTVKRDGSAVTQVGTGLFAGWIK